jgi:DNA-binding CsgD family transcriptional regulator
MTQTPQYDIEIAGDLDPPPGRVYRAFTDRTSSPSGNGRVGFRSTRHHLVGGEEQLTASERRVAELAAARQSNPEIAHSLFVTRKAVETHLGHVHRKLGISRRGELGRALAEQAAAGRKLTYPDTIQHPRFRERCRGAPRRGRGADGPTVGTWPTSTKRTTAAC